MAGRFLPLASQATTAELLRVLAYPKFQLTSDDIGTLLADYLPFVEPVQIPAGPLALPEPPDPSDRIFLQLAAAGKAPFLVTGDRELLAMESVGACRIVAGPEFLATVEGRGG